MKPIGTHTGASDNTQACKRGGAEICERAKLQTRACLEPHGKCPVSSWENVHVRDVDVGQQATAKTRKAMQGQVLPTKHALDHSIFKLLNVFASILKHTPHRRDAGHFGRRGDTEVDRVDLPEQRFEVVDHSR